LGTNKKHAAGDTAPEESSDEVRTLRTPSAWREEMVPEVTMDGRYL